jgi:hypothetical protein
MSIRGQTTRCGPPAWLLGVGLTTLHLKNKLVTKNQTELRTWTDAFDKPPERRNMNVGWGVMDWIGLAQDRNR